jgi:regulatory protein
MMRSLRLRSAKLDVTDPVAGPVNGCPPDKMSESPELSEQQTESAEPSDAKGRARPLARNLAMNWLGRREYSRAELSARLTERDYSAEEVSAALASLLADNLQSDERFAEALVAVRIRKGRGPVRIRAELKRRGVSAELIALHIESAGFDWNNLAREVRDKKFGAKIPTEYKEKARQMRFLEYRGFDSEHIRAAVGEDY